MAFDSSSSSSSSSSVMSLLPEDLLLAVLAQVPEHEVHRLRSVCKAWNTTFSSPDFWDVYEQLQRHKDSWLVFYDPWMGGTLQSLCWAGSSSQRPSRNTLTLPAAMFVSDWAASKGRVCVQCHRKRGAYAGDSAYFVMTSAGAWEALPEPPRTASMPKIWSMAADSSGEGYWIVLLLDGGATFVQRNATPSVAVFSSASGRWATALQLPHATRPSSSATIAGDSLCTIDLARRSLLSLDLNHQHWKHAHCSLPSRLALSPLWHRDYLLDMVPAIFPAPRGKLLLVGSLESSAGCPEWIGVVWELDRSSGVWTEATRSPLCMWEALLAEVQDSREPSLISIKYLGEGDHLFIMATGSSLALSYSLSHGTWDTLELPSTL